MDVVAAATGSRRRVRGRVTRANRAGLVLDVGGISAFLPYWELPFSDALRAERLVGTSRRVYVLGTTRQHALVSSFSPRKRRRRGFQPFADFPDRRSLSERRRDGGTSKASAIRRMFVRLGLRSPRSMPPT